MVKTGDTAFFMIGATNRVNDSYYQRERKGAMNTMNAGSQRRLDLDWLRVILILIVFVFHTGRFFDTMDWHVKNAITSPLMTMWTTFLASWMMPMIFIISGASLFFALGKGGVGKFTRDKVLRLVVPLVVGVFTQIPLAVYLERFTHRQTFLPFFQWLPQYFNGLYGFGTGNFAWMGLHLWYLLVLFVFCMVFLPLFLLFKGPARRVLHWLGNVFAFPGVVYLLAIPVIMVTIGISPRTPLGERNWGGWSLLGYIPVFLYGFLIISHAGLQETIRRLRWVSLAFALASTAGLVYTGSLYGNSPYGTQGYNLFNGFFGLEAWLVSLVALGFGLKRLNFSTPFLVYANEAVMPFYVLHQTVLLGVGYFVTRLHIPDVVKFPVILLTSFIFIMVVYEFLIRRINVLRILFGMKASSRKQLPVPAPKTDLGGIKI
jgi:glucan biosynthesis protein C